MLLVRPGEKRATRTKREQQLPRLAAPGLWQCDNAESQAAKAQCWEAKEQGSYLGNLIQGCA